MKILIAYGTRKGWTKKSAEVITDIFKSKPGIEVDLADLKSVIRNSTDLAGYSLTIVGCSIMAGFWKFGVRGFLKKSKTRFNSLALFISAGATLENARQGKMSKKEAVSAAITKYIVPVKRRYRLTTVLDGAFGGQYDTNGKILFNSWEEQDVKDWAEVLYDKIKSNE
jgi:menaquinone-dependent protoporphyrinogen IX oxidase